MRRHHLIVAAVLLIVLPALAAGEELRVMTFNIRVASVDDGPNGWALRREILFGTIEKFGPDLLGLQEVEPMQADELRKRLEGYEMVGVPRDDQRAERSPAMYRLDRFEQVRGGTFWLSETPDVPSKGWDAAFARVCSWVELRDRKTAGRSVVFFNTHWDHRGVIARAESAKLMRAKVAEIAGDKPVIVTGDFNTPHDSAGYKELLSDRLFEAFADTHPQPTTQDFTFHGFTGKNTHAKRIDWILRNGAFKTKSAEINRTNEQGRYPSDHFPIEAIFDYAIGN